jgi:squalene synthase HpnC
MPHALPADLIDAYARCQTIARTHYENFPVLSLFLPRALRPHVAAIYAFARAADDLADEGSRSPTERLAALARQHAMIDACRNAAVDDPVPRALGHTVAAFAIPLPLLHDLIAAFEEDAVQTRYRSFNDLLRYCERSANPIGRMLLLLFRCPHPEAVLPADALCTALQLTNFWQDVSRDVPRGRVFFPAEDMERFHVTDDALRVSPAPQPVRELLRFEIRRTRDYFAAADALFPLLPWRLRMNLRATRGGGRRILERIEQADCNVTAFRPALTRMEYAAILSRAVFPDTAPSRRTNR